MIKVTVTINTLRVRWHADAGHTNYDKYDVHISPEQKVHICSNIPISRQTIPRNFDNSNNVITFIYQSSVPHGHEVYVYKGFCYCC